MNRRTLLSGSTCLFALPLLVACNGTASANVATAIADANLLIGSATTIPPTGLAGAYATLTGLFPKLIPSDTADVINKALAKAPGYLAVLAPVADAVTNATGLSEVVSIAIQVVNLVGGVAGAAIASNPVLAAVYAGFQAAEILAASIQGIADQLSPSTKVGALPVSGAFRSAMSPDQARAALTAVGR